MFRNRKAQSGQAILLIAIFMVVGCLFALLALDGGNYYEGRRTAQNAADICAQDSGYYFTHEGDWEAGGQKAVDLNMPGASLTQTKFSDPDTAHYPNAILIKCHVEQARPTYFGGIIGIKELVVSAEAIQRILPFRIDGTTPGTLTTTSQFCNNPNQVSSGNFKLPWDISFADIDVSAAWGEVGTAIHLGDLRSSQRVVIVDEIQLSEPLAIYGVPYIPDYAPNGKIGLEESAKGTYFYYLGNYSVNFNTGSGSELNGKTVYIDGDFQSVGSPPNGFSITLVTTGQADLSANGITLSAHRDNLLMASAYKSTNCAGNGITFSTRTATVNGGFYVPDSGIRFSASQATINGWVVSLFGSFAASNTTFVGDANNSPLKDMVDYLVL